MGWCPLAGAYAIYRAVAKAAGSMAQDFKTDLTNTEPAVEIPFNPAWVGTEKVRARSHIWASLRSVCIAPLSADRLDGSVGPSRLERVQGIFRQGVSSFYDHSSLHCTSRPLRLSCFMSSVNIQPTIAVTKAHICMPELEE